MFKRQTASVQFPAGLGRPRPRACQLSPWAAVFLLLPTSCASKDRPLEAGDDFGPAGRQDAGPPKTGSAGTSNVAPPITSGQVDEPFICDVDYFEDASPVQSFEGLRAVVVDEMGKPVPNVTAQTCGVNLCLFGATDDVGYVSFDGPQDFKKAAFKYGDGIGFAQFALELTGPGPHDLGEQRTFALPAYAKGQAFEAGTTVSSGPATLTLEEDTVVKIDAFAVSEDQARFIAKSIDPSAFPNALPEAIGAELLFYLGPLHTEFCPPAELSLPNTNNWEEGQLVEILFHGTDVSGAWAPYAEWAVVAEGRVQGELLITDPGSGLPMLGALAVRRKSP